MARLRLRITTPDDEGINAYTTGEHLRGQKTALALDGEPMAGPELANHLRRLGVGPVTVTVRGRYQPAEQAQVEDLPEWVQHTTVAGGLDPAGLGRLTHALARRFRDKEKARIQHRDTPPEVYLLGIEIESAAPGKRAAYKMRKERIKRTGTVESVPRRETVRYRDSRTGKLVSKATWERSRRAIRARTPKGKRAKPGRYVREVTVR